jgi:hypothetical protein
MMAMLRIGRADMEGTGIRLKYEKRRIGAAQQTNHSRM